MLAAQWSRVLDPNSTVWVEQWRTYLPELAGRVIRRHALDRRQRQSLWSELVRESATDLNLLNADAIAQWASQGWATLRSWELTQSRESGDSETLAQLRKWGGLYEDYLDGRGWTDTERILEEFAQLAPVAALSNLRRRVELLDIENPTVLERRCLDLLSSAGWTIARRELPQIES